MEKLVFLSLFILSNFFKYLSSNFLLFHPNKIFIIYFPSNLLLLNTSVSEFNTLFFSFLIHILFIFFSLIFFSNSFTKSIIFSKFSNFFQVSSFAIYPFYLTKYFSFSLTSLLFNIFLTLYSFSPSISTGESEIFFCIFTCF